MSRTVHIIKLMMIHRPNKCPDGDAKHDQSNGDKKVDSAHIAWTTVVKGDSLFAGNALTEVLSLINLIEFNTTNKELNDMPIADQ